MNGAESLVKTLLAGGVDTCFANPGTSEMHFVAALDSHPEMRCVLCLFEGGTAGAADGYWRMTGKVAATLLHLAPGFGNAYACTHNARKAHSAILHVMGDHATHHLRFESPLKGNTLGVAQAVSDAVFVSSDARAVAADGARALRAARSNGGQIATLILPADTAWEAADGPAETPAAPPRHRPRTEKVEAAARALREPGAALLIDGPAMTGDWLPLAARIAAASGARLIGPTFAPVVARGAGTPPLERIPYVVDRAVELMKGLRHLVLLGCDRPATFFAYPGKPSTPEPPECAIHDLCPRTWDIPWTLEALADAVGATGAPSAATLPLDLPAIPSGPLDAERAGAIIAALLPENAVVVDESVTASFFIGGMTRTARRHDWLHTCGGAIGHCLPCATGAAIGAPDRKVLALTGDGSAMYTLQSLWTMARERLDVTVVVFANRSYKILHGELLNVGASHAGRNARAMFDLEDPALDWVALARGHGVEGLRAETCEAFADALQTGLATDGPFLIEVAC